MTETGILRTWQPARHACRHLHYFWWHISAALSPALDLLMELGFELQSGYQGDGLLRHFLKIASLELIGLGRFAYYSILEIRLRFHSETPWGLFRWTQYSRQRLGASLDFTASEDDSLLSATLPNWNLGTVGWACLSRDNDRLLALAEFNSLIVLNDIH